MFTYTIECKHKDSYNYSPIYQGNEYHIAKQIIDDLVKDDKSFDWNNEYHYRIIKTEVIYDAPMKVDDA